MDLEDFLGNIYVFLGATIWIKGTRGREYILGLIERLRDLGVLMGMDNDDVDEDTTSIFSSILKFYKFTYFHFQLAVGIAIS